MRIDLADRRVHPVCDLDGCVGPSSVTQLRVDVSPDGRFAGVVEARGPRGVIVDLRSGVITLHIGRGSYCVEHCEHSLAFAYHPMARCYVSFADGVATLSRLVMEPAALDWARHCGGGGPPR